MVISLAAIFTIAAFVNSVRGSLLLWIDQMVTADIIISSGARTAGPSNVSLREEPLPGLQALPGVKIVDLYRLVRANYQGRPIVVESFSAAASARVRTLPMAEGDGSRALREMGEGKGAIVSESFQTRFGKNINDSIRTDHAFGAGDFQGAGDLHRLFFRHRQRVDRSGAVQEILARRIGRCLRSVVGARRGHGGGDSKNQGGYGERYQLFISTHRELKDAVVRIMEQSFVVNYAVEIVAVVVAIFSVINTLLGVDPRPQPRDRRIARHRRDPVANTPHHRHRGGLDGI